MTNGRSYAGSCHCGNIVLAYRTSVPPSEWPIRACQCSFCRAHGAETTSDPSGSVTFRVADADRLQQYRFGSRSADFLVCGICGVYVAAVMKTSRGQFATVNVNTLAAAEPRAAAAAVSYDEESSEEKRSRREQRWTPLAAPI